MAPSYLRGLWFEQTWIYIPKDTSTQVTDFLANLFLRRGFWWIFLYTFQFKIRPPLRPHRTLLLTVFQRNYFKVFEMSSFWLQITCECQAIISTNGKVVDYVCDATFVMIKIHWMYQLMWPKRSLLNRSAMCPRKRYIPRFRKKVS